MNARGPLLWFRRPVLDSRSNMENKKSPRLDRLYKKEDQKISYLGSGIGPNEVLSMFHRSFQLINDSPWKHLPSSQVPIYVDIPRQRLKGAVVVKFQPRPKRHGIAVFPSSEHWQAWLRGYEIPRSLLHTWSRLVLIFDEKAPLTPKQRQEIKEQGWLMPTFYQYPDWFAVDPLGMARSIVKEELVMLEAIAGALMGSFYGESRRQWIKIWEGVTPRAQFRHRVPGCDGIVEVTTRSRPLLGKSFPGHNVVRRSLDKSPFEGAS